MAVKLGGIREWWRQRRLSSSSDRPGKAPGWRRRAIYSVMGVFLLIQLGLAWYWSREPDISWIERGPVSGQEVVGFATTQTLVKVASTLLDKPGGYLSNDIAPPGVFLDNMPSWELGVLTQVRDLARVLRNDYSRSQSQSTEDPALARGEPAFNFDNDSWWLPSSESKYREGINDIEDYLVRLQDPARTGTQFFARADNLREWLAVVEKRLGSLSQRLSASVGQERVNTDLANDPSAESTTPQGDNVVVKTPWLEIDDVFYEARGTSWALVNFIRAAQFDFSQVLKDKNAEVSLRQIIRELEGSLQPMGSPMVLNGSGFGLFPNHSLVMASYLARANSAVINLRELLDQG
jgi:hypothetical protein